jgi:hypothetical protein
VFAYHGSGAGPLLRSVGRLHWHEEFSPHSRSRRIEYLLLLRQSAAALYGGRPLLDFSGGGSQAVRGLPPAAGIHERQSGGRNRHEGKVLVYIRDEWRPFALESRGGSEKERS